MNSSPDGIFFKDKELKIQRANRSFAQVLGVSVSGLEALLVRARRALRGRLTDDAGDAS